MLSKETEVRVCKILLAIAEGEQSIEVNRQNLFDNNNIDPLKLFRRLDNESKNRIDSIDISAFLKSKGIYCADIEAQFLILFYDEDGDGLLSYSEFLNMLKPLHYNPSNNNMSHNHNEMPSYNEEYTISKFLETEIEQLRKITIMINDLKLRSDFNIHNIYHAIKNMNCITVESLKSFFDRNNITYVPADITAIIKRLDFNKDGNIDICELHALLGFPSCERCCPCSIKCNCICCEHCCCKYTCGYTVKPKSSSTLNEYNYNQYQLTSQTLNNNEENNTYSKRLSLRLSPERKYSPISSSPPHQKLFHLSKHYPFSTSVTQCNLYTKNQKHKFLNYFQTIMQFESKIEHTKIGLSIRDDFNIEDAFRIFEINGRDYLTEDDLKHGLNAFGIYPKPFEIHLLMKRYDIKNEGVLTYADFFDMVTPYEKPYRVMMERRPPKIGCSCQSGSIFLFTTRLLMKELFVMLFEYECKVNCIKKDFNGVRSKLREIFNEIDVKNRGSFDEKDLELYLHKNDIFTSMKDTFLLFIHLDRNRDGKVDYFELEKELTPLY